MRSFFSFIIRNASPIEGGEGSLGRRSVGRVLFAVRYTDTPGPSNTPGFATVGAQSTIWSSCANRRGPRDFPKVT